MRGAAPWREPPLAVLAWPGGHARRVRVRGLVHLPLMVTEPLMPAKFFVPTGFEVRSL